MDEVEQQQLRKYKENQTYSRFTRKKTAYHISGLKLKKKEN